MTVCNVNCHQGRWVGRYFEVTSTELHWTGQEAGKNPAILSKGHQVSCQHNGIIKPSFIPEPPVTTRADPCPSTACDVTSFNVKDNFVC